MSTAPAARLLVVDDEPDLRTLYELTLVREGYDVECAGSVEEAWAMLTQSAYQLLITDMRLPDGSGLDLCRRVRANPTLKQMPLIALSADALPEHIARALQTGFNHYLVKPLQIQRLLSSLATLPSTQAAPPQT